MKIYCNRLDKYDLHQYIGKDLWVKVRTPGSYTNAYIRVLDINSDMVTFNYVFSSEINKRRLGVHPLDDILNRDYEKPIDWFYVCNPLDVITTQDILDAFGVEE